jgi:hypothetical protein
MAYRQIPIITIAATLLAPVAFVPSAHAGWDGPEYKVEDKEDEYKVEYKDGRCEYKYELKYKDGEEKFEEKGDCRGVAMPRPHHVRVLNVPEYILQIR